MIERILHKIILERLNSGKAIILLGARQTGKTTLIKQIASEFEGNYLFINCDEPMAKELLENAGSERLKQLIGDKKIIIIDEAQRIINIGLTLKLITDQIKDVQLIVSGSSALELSNEINEPLTGRKLEYYLYPISYKELSDQNGAFETLNQLEQRIIFGMYPDVINNKGNEIEILNNLAGSYLYKDLLSYQGIRKADLLEKILKALAMQIGNEVSFSEIANLVQVDKTTVMNYINLLEKVFVIFRLQPLSRNHRKEISTSRKIYFYDNGIRNALINNFNPLSIRQDAGFLWENFIVSERIKSNHYKKHYVNSWFWRTYAKEEIDYIEEEGNSISAFEIKWNKKAKAKIPAEFKRSYPEATFSLITPVNFIDFI